MVKVRLESSIRDCVCLGVTVPHVRVNQTVLEPKSSAASACAQTGRCERCSGAMENACMQIATAHGAIWACVLAGFYSASGVGEVVLQRVVWLKSATDRVWGSKVTSKLNFSSNKTP